MSWPGPGPITSQLAKMCVLRSVFVSPQCGWLRRVCLPVVSAPLLRRRNWTQLAGRRLRQLEEGLLSLAATRPAAPAPAQPPRRPPWSFCSALLYCVTVITTIGKSAIAIGRIQTPSVSLLSPSVGYKHHRYVCHRHRQDTNTIGRSATAIGRIQTPSVGLLLSLPPPPVKHQYHCWQRSSKLHHHPRTFPIICENQNIIRCWPIITIHNCVSHLNQPQPCRPWWSLLTCNDPWWPMMTRDEPSPTSAWPSVQRDASVPWQMPRGVSSDLCRCSTV